MAYARANGLNRVVIDSPRARLGIITTGKSYLDVRQALDALGIDEALAAEIGLRVFKIGMTWPLDAEGVRHFAEGLEEILVVEEKRQVIEYQLKEQLYNWREDVRPRVTGKYDETGEWELPGGDWQLPGRRRADPGAHRARDRPAPGALPHQRPDPGAPRLPRGQGGGAGSAPRRRQRVAARAALLLRLPAQHLDQGAGRAAARSPASGATTWRCGSTRTRRRPSARWAARACPGSAKRPSPRRSTSSPTSATAPTRTRGCWPSARRSRRRCRSPTRSCSTTRSP